MGDTPIYLEGSPWVKMTGTDWSELVQGYRPIKYKKGHIFYEQYEACPNIFVIETGRVAMCISTPTGGLRIVAVLDEGCIIGNQKLFDEMPNSCSAVALSDSCSVYEVPIDKAQRLVGQSTQMIRNMLIQSNRVNRMLLTQIDQMSFKSSESRVCFVLYCVAEQYADNLITGEKSGTKRIQFRFTHQDLADVTGLSRVSVSTVFSKLMRDEIISKENGTYFVKNMELLKKRISET